MSINGIINIKKEKGYTSHDVVAKMRGILQQKKIGHTGTLDPDATGVLPVCLGNATKLCDMLVDKSKVYRVEFMLGVVTDTQDISGTCIEKKEVDVTEEKVLSVINSFLGESMQIPPMYSALKVNGKKLYELAREGKEVERKAREIVITNILVESINLPNIVMTVDCSKGTYIRTLCHDIGAILGCGAVMTELSRLRVGDFEIADAITLGELEVLRDEGTVKTKVRTVESFFATIEAIHAKVEFQRFLDNGNSLFLNQISEDISPIDGQLVRTYSCEGDFRAVYSWNESRNCFMPYQMFGV